MGNLTETMNLLAEAGAEKTSSYLSKRPSPATMVETLLSAFNNNPHNTRTAEYLFRQNLFELIGKSRHEMVHSRMIAELLAGRYYDISKKMTLMHFFDIVVMRAKEQGVSVPQEFLDAVLTRSLTIESLVDRQTEYPLNSYIKDYANNAGCDVDNKKRLDIFLRYNLASTLKKSGNKIVEIFIENKVLSNEHNQQTQTYYDICADNRRALQLFIYLSPITQKELNDYTNISDNMKPSAVDKSGKPVFIHICYQDILDRIIAPLMNGESMNERDTVILGEYANCLELPSLPDSDDKKLQAKELSIMAIGNKLKLMLTEFMKSEENARLLEAAASYHLGKKLYSYNGIDCVPFDQALQVALIDYTSKNGELRSMKAFKSIIGAQKGGARFLIYAVKVTDDKIYYLPTHLYEYNGMAFKTITLALKAAVKDYVSRTGKTTDEVIKDFEVIYRRQKWHPHVFKKTIDPIAGVTYSPTVFTGLFVREDINADKLRYINDILGDGFGISPISSECYHELIMNRNDTLWECYDRTLFTPLKGTDYFYRKGGEHRIKEINTVLHDKINESKLCPSDENLLDKFYANNRILILSIYRILLESEQDAETYEQRKKDYINLLKN